MIAFSAVSFAGTVEVKKEEPKKETKENVKRLPPGCATIINHFLETMDMSHAIHAANATGGC